MKFEIKSRWNGSVLFSLETDSLKLAVEAAVKSKANLREANLRGANLREADLYGANLRGADLREADLREADLTFIRDDLWAVLSATPAEVPGLRRALIDGKVDGSVYESAHEGACACLVGTLANVRHCKYDAIPNLKPDSSRPAEVFFTRIKPGQTPDNSPDVKLVIEWIDTWLANMQAAFGAAK